MSIPNLVMGIFLMALGVVIARRTRSNRIVVAAIIVFLIGLALLLQELEILRIRLP